MHRVVHVKTVSATGWRLTLNVPNQSLYGMLSSGKGKHIQL